MAIRKLKVKLPPAIAATLARDKTKFSAAKKTWVDGIEFDSGAEARRYGELKWLEKCGKIKVLNHHTTHPLKINGRPIRVKSDGYPKGRKATYTDDFNYFELTDEIIDGERAWQWVVEDVKGRDTTAMRFRRGVFEALYGVEVRLIR